MRDNQSVFGISHQTQRIQFGYSSGLRIVFGMISSIFHFLVRFVSQKPIFMVVPPIGRNNSKIIIIHVNTAVVEHLHDDTEFLRILQQRDSGDIIIILWRYLRLFAMPQ